MIRIDKGIYTLTDKKHATYICFEGEEGTGKTTQTWKLTKFLRAQGYSVLETKEPGTSHLPLTMALRKIMLDGQYDEQITPLAREFVSQAIRSIHLEQLVIPAIEEYDYIIQDRGILSGLAYGAACGNDEDMLKHFADLVCQDKNVNTLYNKVVYLTGDINAGLKRALASKQEFEAGDAMESRGNTFLQQVANNFSRMGQDFNTSKICVDDKGIEEVFSEILNVLELN